MASHQMKVEETRRISYLTVKNKAPCQPLWSAGRILNDRLRGQSHWPFERATCDARNGHRVCTQPVAELVQSEIIRARQLKKLLERISWNVRRKAFQRAPLNFHLYGPNDVHDVEKVQCAELLLAFPRFHAVALVVLLQEEATVLESFSTDFFKKQLLCLPEVYC